MKKKNLATFELGNIGKKKGDYRNLKMLVRCCSKSLNSSSLKFKPENRVKSNRANLNEENGFQEKYDEEELSI